MIVDVERLQASCDCIQRGFECSKKRADRLQAERDRLREALDDINLRAAPRIDRTLGQASDDLYWCCCHARAALERQP